MRKPSQSPNRRKKIFDSFSISYDMTETSKDEMTENLSPKEDAKKIVEYILEQSGDGKKAPIRVKSCCCRPCGMDMERKHQFKEMRFREMFYNHEAYIIENPPPSHPDSPEVELPVPKTKKIKK